MRDVNDASLTFLSRRKQRVGAAAFPPLIVEGNVTGKDESTAIADILQQEIRLRVGDRILSRENNRSVAAGGRELLLKEQIKRNFVLDQHLLDECGGHVVGADAVSHRRPVSKHR